MKTTNVLCRFTVFLMVLLCIAVPVLASCARPGGDTSTSKVTDAPGVSATETAAVTDNKYADDIPDSLRFDNKTVSILMLTQESAKNEIGVEQLNGDIINDAVFARDTATCERLGITMSINKLVGLEHNAAISIIENAIGANDNTYNLLINNSYKTLAAAVKGDFLNLKNVDNINLEKPYWSAGFNDAISIGNAQYIATGPMSLSFFRYLEVVAFNKNMFKASGVEFPYKTVLDNKWTIDEHIKIANQFYTDVNGNSVADESDIYGFASRAASCLTDGYWSAFDLRTVVKNQENYYTYSIDTEHFNQAAAKMIELYYSKGSFGKLATDEDVYTKFSNCESATANVHLYCVETANLREMTDDYGLLPMPKLSEAQEDYYSYCQDQLLVYCIPANVSRDDADMVGAFMEVLASESYKTVKPAYYDVSLTSKYAKDAESIQMLDIVTSKLYLDASALYVGTLPFSVSKLRSIVNDKQTDISSMIKTYDKIMNVTIIQINKNYSDIVSK